MLKRISYRRLVFSSEKVLFSAFDIVAALGSTLLSQGLGIRELMLITGPRYLVPHVVVCYLHSVPSDMPR